MYNNKTFFELHFGRYPTIYLDFKLLSGESFDGFINDFIELVAIEFRRHLYIIGPPECVIGLRYRNLSGT